jgi:prepilin-type N-terminal cleavage/methylation domain-containing protein/prepilin-type processing-associated H-X9-DG protein
MRRDRKLGFTLIELMVVVVIIALLAGLALPAIGRALTNAQKAKCMNNMRQIGLAMMTYAGENNYRLPETSHTVSIGNTWINVLEPYLSNMDEVRICPADPLKKERLAAGGTSYILNSFLFVPQIDPFGNVIGGPTNNLLHIERPSQTMMAFIISENQAVGASNDHTHSSTWISWGAVTSDISPDRFTASSQPDHSVGSSNYLFADGRVESLDASLVKARIENGENIAEPK